MTQSQEKTVTALRRAFREFCDKAGALGCSRLQWQVDEREGAGLPQMDFHAQVRIEEEAEPKRQFVSEKE